MDVGAAGAGGAAAGATAGGAGTGGAGAGGEMNNGGAATGGTAGAGGSPPVAGAGGAAGGADAGGAGGEGGMAGAGGGDSPANETGPCDIYAEGGTPCVAAYSSVRRIASTYSGPLYQIRRGAPDPNTGSGGETMDIPILANGFADAAAHAEFCGDGPCTFSVLYDQSGQGNDLTVAKAGCYGCDFDPPDTACEDDYESDATRSMTVGGNTVYRVYMDTHEGYRNNQTTAVPVGEEAQGIYMVAEGAGQRPNAASACCWNFGNVSTNNCFGPSGQMNTLFLGKAFWGKGAGSGPWFMGDFEAGVWAGGSEPGDPGWGSLDGAASAPANSNNPSMTMDYAFGVIKTNSTNYAIRTADATTGELSTAYDGALPSVFPNRAWSMQGGVALGIGGDNSNHAAGTFLEGAITAGRPTDEVDTAVHENVKSMRYGQ